MYDNTSQRSLLQCNYWQLRLKSTSTIQTYDDDDDIGILGRIDWICHMAPTIQT